MYTVLSANQGGALSPCPPFPTLMQTGACLAAVHHYCKAKYCGVSDAGMAQEVPPDSLYVSCFKSSLNIVSSQ